MHSLEQTLESGEVCNLVEMFMNKIKDTEEAKKVAKYAYLYAKIVSLGRVHWKDTNNIVERNHRLGVSMTGIMQFISKHGRETLIDTCDMCYNEIQEQDDIYSGYFQVPKSIKTTSVKPSGSIALLGGASPGVHPHLFRQYIRRITFDKASDMVPSLKEAGYNTCISGKWQLNGLSYKDQFSDWDDPTRPVQMGFDEYCLWQLTHGRAEGERYANPLIEQNGMRLETGPDDYGPDIFCNYILDFIDRNRNEPFFVYYPMVLVHEPFVPTPDAEKWVARESRYDADTAFFGDMVTYSDKVVGQIIDRLEKNGISKNTLVIFTGDNGTHTTIFSHTRNGIVRGAKGNTITHGVHVPLLISWPGQIKGPMKYTGLIEFSDFHATLADLVNRNVSSDGHSFLGLLTGKKFIERETVQVHYDPRWSPAVNRYRNNFVQNMEYKLYQDGSFYKISVDILEKNPLPVEGLESDELKIYQQLKDELDRELVPLKN